MRTLSEDDAPCFPLPFMITSMKISECQSSTCSAAVHLLYTICCPSQPHAAPSMSVHIMRKASTPQAHNAAIPVDGRPLMEPAVLSLQLHALLAVLSRLASALQLVIHPCTPTQALSEAGHNCLAELPLHANPDGDGMMQAILDDAHHAPTSGLSRSAQASVLLPMRMSSLQLSISAMLNKVMSAQHFLALCCSSSVFRHVAHPQWRCRPGLNHRN